MSHYDEGYEKWLILHSKTLAAYIFFKKVGSLSVYFLLSRKLVTKSFSGINILNRHGSHFSLEIKKIYKILLINTRKRFPLTKLENTEYKYPFIQYLPRLGTIYLNFDTSNNNEAKILRYMRYVGINYYITINYLPLAIHNLTDNIITDRGERESIFRLSFCITEISYSHRVYLILFLIPNILQIISTLHRKAFFRDNLSTLVNPVVRTTVSSEDDNMGNDAVTIEDILGELDDNGRS